jgi:hypothetical protein
VSDILHRLKDVGLYDGQYQEPPRHWFHTKKGKENRPMWESLAYFTFYPPAANSPLTITQALIFARLRSLSRERKQTHTGLATLLKMSRQTIITNCKALIALKLIDSDLHPIDLTPETQRYFMSKTEMLTMKVPPPEEVESEQPRPAPNNPRFRRPPSPERKAWVLFCTWQGIEPDFAVRPTFSVFLTILS